MLEYSVKKVCFPSYYLLSTGVFNEQLYRVQQKTPDVFVFDGDFQNSFPTSEF